MRISLTLAALAITLSATANDFGPKPLTLFDPAPELAIKTVKGKPVTLAEGKNKNLYIVEFWATWCAPCKYSIPHLTALQRKYKNDGLIIVGISDEDLRTVQPYVAKMGPGMDYTVAIDDDRATWNRYMKPFGLSGIPQAFVIDKAGRIIWYGHPMDPILEPLVEALLEDEPSPPAESDPPAEDQLPADSRPESTGGHENPDH